MPRYDTLTSALRGEIARRGLTQEAAALSAGVSYNQMNRWIHGQVPMPRSYTRLADWLGVTIFELGGLIAMDQVERLGVEAAQDGRPPARRPARN